MAGLSGEVSETVLKEIVYSGAEYGAFDLINALDRRDARTVFRLYENVRKTSDPYMLLGAFNWHFSSRRGGCRAASRSLRLCMRLMWRSNRPTSASSSTFCIR